MAVADLIYKISGDSSAFIRALKAADDQIAKSTGNMSRMGKASAMLAAGIGTVGTYLGAMTKQALSDADALGKLSYRTGVQVEELARLEHALGLSDSSLKDFEIGAKNLNKILADTEAGNEKAAKALTALGVSALDAQGKARPLNDVFLDIATQFKAMPDGAQKSTAAFNLFGKAGISLIPTLNSGADGLRAMGDEAEQLGLVMSKDVTDAAQLVNDNITRLERAGAGLGRQILTTMAPAFAVLSSEMVENAKQADNMRARQESATYGMKVMLVAVRSLGFAFDYVGNLIARVLAGAMNEIDLFLKIGKNIPGALKEMLTGPGESMRAISEAVTIANELQAQMDADRKTLLADYEADVKRIWAAQPEIPPPQLDQRASEEQGRRFGRAVRQGAKSELDKIADDMQRAADRIFADTRTAAERAAADFAELDALVAGGFLSEEVANRRAQQIEAERDQAANEALRALMDRGREVRESLLTDAQILENKAAELRGLFYADIIDEPTLTAALAKLQAEFDATTATATELVDTASSIAPAVEESFSALDKIGVTAATSLADGFQQFLFDPFNTSLGDMVKNFAAAIAKMVTELLAKQAVLALFGGANASPGIASALGFASGGYVSGPGTGTSDSIPARLSNGEYVMPAKTVSHFGVDFMDAIRAMRPARQAPVARFAEGGYVSQQSSGGGGVRVVNVVDSSMVQDFLTSSAGEQVILNTIRRNRRQVSQVMG